MVNEDTDMSVNAREAILDAAKAAAQTHGYNGINFRSIGEVVGIKNASIYYHFPSKADLGAAVAERYWHDAAKALDDIREANPEPQQSLKLYPLIFRTSLENGNRLCLVSFMAAEYQDLPDPVKDQVKKFAEVNIEWLTQVLIAAGAADEDSCKARARAIYAAVAGAQLIARSRGDIALFDELIGSYESAGLISADFTE